MNRFVLRSIFTLSTATLLLGAATTAATAAGQQDQQGNAFQFQQGQGQNNGFPQGGQGQGQGGPGGGGGGGRGGFGGQGGQGGPGRGGFGGPGGMMGMMGMMGNRAPSAANLSLRLMATYLNLNESQISKIALARDDMQESSRMVMPRGGNAGNPPDMQTMMADMQAKRQSAERKAIADIKAVLTPEQSTKLAVLIKAMESLQTAGYRPDAVGPLKLTDEQLTRIGRGGALASILTPEQMTIAETYRMPPPGQGRPGGFGGQGGPGRGGPGGPGGPGGQGAPPPGGQGL